MKDGWADGRMDRWMNVRSGRVDAYEDRRKDD